MSDITGLPDYLCENCGEENAQVGREECQSCEIECLKNELAAVKAELENERMKVAGCSTAALGFWKEGDSLHPDYECAAIHDAAKLYARMVNAEAERDALKQKSSAGNDAIEAEVKEVIDMQRTRFFAGLLSEEVMSLSDDEVLARAKEEGVDVSKNHQAFKAAIDSNKP